MANTISPLAHVDSSAQLGQDIFIGPFCLVGPDVILGDGCRLDSHVTITGRTTIGARNRFWPGCVIGAEPQDKSYCGQETGVVIGDDNQFREGVTINRGAPKEDGITRVGNRTMVMANAHVAHNCWIQDEAMLVNGVLLGGHVHIEPKAIVSGNTVVHHFATIGRLAFVGGGFRITRDVPPFLMAAGSDKHTLPTINKIGLERAGFSKELIAAIRLAHRMLFREYKKLSLVREHFKQINDGKVPDELIELFDFLDRQNAGRMGRGREIVREAPPSRKAA